MSLPPQAEPLGGAPVRESERIASLDVLRGFALLGILLLNILGFGLASASYSNPGFDVTLERPFDLATWATVELFAEGAMRCLFSILFGAGVMLFAQPSKGRGAWLHYKRTLWLLAFGLVDAYLLLWNGDILITYALASLVLYWFRNLRPRTLLVLAGLLLAAIAAFYALVGFGLEQARSAAATIERAADPDAVPSGTRSAAAAWSGFAEGFDPAPEKVAAELAARRGSYLSAFRWNAGKTNEMLAFVVPVFLFWDALVMMLIGMALFKLGVLQGERTSSFYRRLAVIGFACGLLVNGYEVTRAIGAELDLFTVFAQVQPTYHVGRLGMALGYIGLVVGLTRAVWPRARRLLAAVGRTALSNYLLQSLMAMLVFTGAGLGLVGQLSRAGLYPVVLAFWAIQLLLSHWWMQRFLYGPAEWLWRLLTYGRVPPFRRLT